MVSRYGSDVREDVSVPSYYLLGSGATAFFAGFRQKFLV